MNPSDPSPAPQKSGLSGLAIAGIGCGVFALAGILATIILFRACTVRVKQVTDDFQKNPGRTAAMLAVKANPNLELVNTDDSKGEITVRDKKTGETTTMSFDDVSHGKFVVKNSKAETISVDTTGANGSGLVTIKGKDGSTVVGGDPAATLPPRWVPSYPAAQAQAGGMKQESGDTIRGSYLARTKDAPAKVKDYFESTLKADGFETEVTSTTADGSESTIISATMESSHRKITIMANAEQGSTRIVITYEGAK